MKKPPTLYTGAPSANILIKKLILAIDDDADLLAVQRTLLETDGFEVLTAQSGNEALELLKKNDKPDLILLDVQMEDMSGLDLLTILETQKIIDGIPVVFLTGRDDVYQSKAAGYIRKPIDLNVYLKAVHHFIDAGARS